MNADPLPLLGGTSPVVANLRHSIMVYGGRNRKLLPTSQPINQSTDRTTAPTNYRLDTINSQSINQTTALHLPSCQCRWAPKSTSQGTSNQYGPYRLLVDQNCGIPGCQSSAKQSQNDARLHRRSGAARNPALKFRYVYRQSMDSELFSSGPVVRQSSSP